MKNIYYIILSIAIVILFYSCSISPNINDFELRDSTYFKKGESIPYTGKVKGLYLSGEDSLSANIEKGKYNGDFTIYFKNGNVKDSIIFNSGVIKSKKSWYSSGTDSLISQFENGRLNGVYLTYHKNSKLKDSILYDNGSIKKMKSWTEYGLIEKTLIKDLIKRPKGMYKIFDNKDTLLFCGLAVDSSYKIDGKKYIKEVNYLDGKPNGLQQVYYLSGKIYYISEIKNGLFEGKTTFYYENGNILSEGTYVNDKENGKFIEYDEKGNIRREAEFRNGSLMMKCKCCGKEYPSEYGWSCNDLGWGYSQLWAENGGIYCTQQCVQSCVNRFYEKKHKY